MNNHRPRSGSGHPRVPRKGNSTMRLRRLAVLGVCTGIGIVAYRSDPELVLPVLAKLLIHLISL